MVATQPIVFILFDDVAERRGHKAHQGYEGRFGVPFGENTKGKQR
jgi:hypothetical protein